MNNRSKKLFENFFLKSFGGSKKVLTFASAFRKKAVKEEFFERFRYEQASSTSLTLSKKQKPSITYKQLRIDLVLEQII